jgi:D-glycero-D-manno-heptose 1,7-bisphosphate phosphatase
MLNPTAFLDRDGVINIDKGYVYKIDDFEWMPDSKEAIKFLKKKNYLVIVVTNQSGISREYYNEHDVDVLHGYINNELRQFGAKVDDFYFSPFHPEVNNKKYEHLSHLRKPNTGMLELAKKKWNIDKSKSFMIGDKLSDIDCASRFGIGGHLYEGGSLLEFVKKLEDFQ